MIPTKVANISLSSTKKAIQNGGNFLISNNMMFPCPVTKVFGVFGNRLISSSSGEATKNNGKSRLFCGSPQ